MLKYVFLPAVWSAAAPDKMQGLKSLFLVLAVATLATTATSATMRKEGEIYCLSQGKTIATEKTLVHV